MLSLSEAYHLKKLKTWKGWSVAKGMLSELTDTPVLLLAERICTSLHCSIQKVPNYQKCANRSITIVVFVRNPKQRH